MTMTPEQVAENPEDFARYINWLHYVQTKQAAKIERLREALEFYAWENQARPPSAGPWGAGSNDFGTVARCALAELRGQSDER